LDRLRLTSHTRTHEPLGTARTLPPIASPTFAGEPATGDDPGALGADVVAALGHLGEVINHRLQFGPLRGEQGFTVEGCGEDLVFCGHA
jgi:hypothetical protein